MAKIGEKKLFNALLDPMLDAQLETQENSNFVKEEDCGKKKKKIKSQVKGAPSFTIFRSQTQNPAIFM
jgi:hypothetical protein